MKRGGRVVTQAALSAGTSLPAEGLFMKREFEVHCEDERADLWVFGSDARESAEGIADLFRRWGFRNVRIVEPQNPIPLVE